MKTGKVIPTKITKHIRDTLTEILKELYLKKRLISEIIKTKNALTTKDDREISLTLCGTDENTLCIFLQIFLFLQTAIQLIVTIILTIKSTRVLVP